MRKTRFLLATGLMLFTSQALARLDIYEMQRLIESGQAEAAYQLAVPYRSAYEGFALFDFYYGWAALDSGHLDEGVFALSRVVMQQPDNGRARLELARGFFLTGENARARQEFETVLGQAPPTGVRSNVQRFLDAIAVRESTYLPSGDAYAQVSLGYDSNINSAPADDPYAGAGGLYGGVVDGSIVVSNGGGERVVDNDQFFHVAGSNSPPRLLPVGEGQGGEGESGGGNGQGGDEGADGSDGEGEGGTSSGDDAPDEETDGTDSDGTDDEGDNTGPPNHGDTNR